MPASRIKPEHRVIQAKPDEKQRTIVISGNVRIQLGPGMSGEIVGEIVPRVDGGVLNNLRRVVVDELKRKSGRVNQKGNSTGEARSDRAVLNPTHAAVVFRRAFSQHYLPHLGIKNVSA